MPEVSETREWTWPVIRKVSMIWGGLFALVALIYQLLWVGTLPNSWPNGLKLLRAGALSFVLVVGAGMTLGLACRIHAKYLLLFLVYACIAGGIGSLWVFDGGFWSGVLTAGGICLLFVLQVGGIIT